jgi:hypothetical protein
LTDLRDRLARARWRNQVNKIGIFNVDLEAKNTRAIDFNEGNKIDELNWRKKMETEKNAKEVVMSCVKALNEENFELAKQYVSHNISFVGVMGSRQGAQAYFDDMERMRLKYDVKKAFVDGRDVCLLYDLTISDVTVFGSAWYQVEGGKIQSLRVVFDPRLILEARSKLARKPA